MREEMRPIVEKIEQLLLESNGAVTEEVEMLLDEAWNIIASDPKNREVMEMPVDDFPEEVTFEELARMQEEMDRDILEMLTEKEQELKSIANERPLSDQEIKTRNTILQFRKEIESGKRCQP